VSEQPDTQSVLTGLKDFQRATVDYVFERFYGPDPTRRFLVADEVGLGKTLVARGVVARAIDHLSDKPRIDVIYICSNTDIARQNIQRLRIPGCADAAQATRLTLLPLTLTDLQKNRINFIALTPATSFEQTGGGGRIDERVLLYSLLNKAWNIHGSLPALYVMKDYASTASFKRSVDAFDPQRVNKQIATEFVASLNKCVNDEKAAGNPDMRSRFEELRGIFCRSDARIPHGATKLRTQWIGELRRMLAGVCLNALAPDLIILDEFQRFRHLLDEQSEAGELARDLFDSEAGQGARVLLLSATPYRGLSLHHETDDDHYGDFLALLRFLEGGDASGCKEILAEYRTALPAVMTADGLIRLRKAKTALQARLEKVMARTERLGSSTTRGGMLLDTSPGKSVLCVGDVRAFQGAQSVADALGQGDVVEYWKSSPYLFNFMDNYALKKAFVEASDQRKMVKFVRDCPTAFLDFDKARTYQPIEAANPRLRELLADTLDRGMWRLLWMPPSLPYYHLAGPFASPQLLSVTKQLVFSAWHMVPRAVASIMSYEAERRMMRALHPRAQVTQEDWKKQRGLLRFGVSGDRLTGLPLLLLVYPCLTFARDCDPRELATGAQLTASETQAQFAGRLRAVVEKLSIEQESGGAADDRWYWVAPMLLDLAEFHSAARAWWNRPDLAQSWAGSSLSDEDAGWSSHVEKAKQTLDAIRTGKERLGVRPEDLFEVLALAASAAPATAALRTYARPSGSEPNRFAAVLVSAARTGRAFLTLFNHAEVIESVRAEFRGEPYWQRVLQYSHSGGLQAVMDEYAHLLRESLGLTGEPAAKAAEHIAAEIISALTIRAASLRIDEVTAPPYAREIKISSEPMRLRFAMRFGDDRYDEEPSQGADVVPAGTRKERVRAAFNSPFWPFVLVSTSVGQEGLDFHYYCHSVTHWNLPANPVDLEQREGRIHRYKGHAIRKNVAAAFGREALAQSGWDVWETAFARGRDSRPKGENDLVPYWLFPGDAKIERHVSALPFSRDLEHLDRLRRALTIYRMVFGQSRQEDLIAYLLAQIPEGEQAEIMAELQISLSPASRVPGNPGNSCSPNLAKAVKASE
jgi:hypothetical protein